MTSASVEIKPSQCAHILAIDVCGTLFDVNTSAGLVTYHHKRVGNSVRSFFTTLITGRQMPLGLACIAIAKITGFDLHRAITLLSLRGEHYTALTQSAQQYLSALEEHRIVEVHDLVQKLRSDGWCPILVSNSVDLIVEPIADSLGVPYLSSRLGWSEGRCTGFLVTDLTGKKLSILESFLGFSIVRDRFRVITDNRSDADLIDRASAPVIVVNGKSRAWMEGFDAEMLYIKQ